MIEHALSGIYDIPHGEGLAIIFPAYMKYIYKKSIGRFKRFAENVWGICEKNLTDEQIALKGIEKTKEYFSSLGSPTILTQIGITENDIDKIANLIVIGGGSYIKIEREDVVQILKLAL